MSDSRENSPDWLRSYKVPTDSPLTLSSNSGSSCDHSASVENKSDQEQSSPKSSTRLEVNKNESTGHGKFFESSPKKILEAATLKKEDQTPSRRKKIDNQKKKEGDGGKKKTVNESDEDIKHKESMHSIWMLSSDSESCRDHSPTREDRTEQVETSAHQNSEFPGKGDCEDASLLGHDGKSPSKKASKEKSSKKQIDVEDHMPLKGKKTKGSAKKKGNGGEVEVKEEETSEKHVEPNVSSSRLPLILSEKVQRTKALIECEGDSIDLSGDVGAVGRVIISDSPSCDQEMYLDLKGTVYKTSIIPSRTFGIVSFGQSEAKIEAIMNDFIQLKPQSNVYEAETMVEGTLDGFSFDSDDEDKMPKAIDKNEHGEEQTNGKTKGKADKAASASKKRGRNTGGKQQPPKKIRKKTQGSKKAKTKK